MKKRCLALGLALGLPTLAHADARIEYRATEGGGASMQTVLVAHGKLRSEVDAQTSVILDPATDTMILLNHGDRTYIRMGRAEMERMSEGLGAAMAQMEQALANVPPEMRGQMQEMLGGMMPGGSGEGMVKVTRTGQTDSVAGHGCTVYRTQVQGETLNETCMGDVAVLSDLSAADRRTLDSAMAMSQRLAESVAKGPMARFVDLSTFQPGMLPLRITDFSGNARSTSEFSGIDNAPLAADLFAVPAGYAEQKIEMPDLRSLGR